MIKGYHDDALKGENTLDREIMMRQVNILMMIFIIFLTFLESQNVFAITTQNSILNKSLNPRFLSIGDSNCLLDYNGMITSCNANNLHLPINGVAYNNDSTFVYLPTHGDTHSTYTTQFYQCAVNQLTGMFDDCTSTTMSMPTDMDWKGYITLNKSNTIAYIRSNQKILACNIKNNAFEGTCTDTGADHLENNANGITLDDADSVAYIPTVGYITICNVKNSTYSNCVVKSGGGNINFRYPTSVALDESDNLIYITDATIIFDEQNKCHSYIYACSTQKNNSDRFSNCFIAFDDTRAVEAMGNDVPLTIAVNKAHTVAYIHSTIGDDPVFFELYSCSIRKDKTLDCDQSLEQTARGFTVALGY